MKKAEQANFPEFEAEMLKIWDAEKTFEQSLKNREGKQRFSFYDGPPFANGLPHYGHVVAITEKDSVTRYKTMRGYYVPRRNGWDTHGLPVEFEVEKQLGISGKRQILEMGIDKFNEIAKASVYKYKSQWEDFMARLGRWADMENSYATMDDDYIESVWWVMNRLHQKGLVYRGFRSSPYCPRCATPLSNFEVNQNYKDNVPDPSVYVKFQLKDDANTSLLAWTTTPWTLPANAALAVAADADYAEIELLDDGDGWQKGEKLILAKERLELLDLKKTEYKVLDTKKGKDFAGAAYQPLYPAKSLGEYDTTTAWRVYVDDSVSLEDGTGVLHVAPRYGETDLELGLREGLPLIESVDGNGQMVEAFKHIKSLEEIVGMFFKKADKSIIEDLTKKGRLFAAETFEHTYPFCWRCETPLMYFALPSWYIKVSELRELLVANNNQVNWIPGHIKEGRFGRWLADARDWNFSRNRFWGAPLPIWVNIKDSEDIIVVSSLDELRELSGHKAEFDLHRPGIDSVVIKRDGKTYRRTEEVFDCWFESGSMPYAQDHWMGGESGEEMPPHFPAQFIAEGVDQTRGWFYTLHVLATALDNKPAFENVVVNGLVLAADGKKLSKRLRNYPDPAEIFATSGADSLRFFLMSSPVVAGEDVRFSAEAVNEVTRNVFTRLWNVYSFFSTYAEIDHWQPQDLTEPKSDNVLDQWLIARLNQVIGEMTEQADAYRIPSAVRPLRDFIDDLSNWYVRRSRRRFWKSEDDGDKASAYATLHYVMVRISQLLAPWSPFVSDKLWRELTMGMDVPKSVHLSDWPEAGNRNPAVTKEMEQIRQGIEYGLWQRAENEKRVRQPLPNAKIFITINIPDNRIEQYKDIIKEELNVKNANIETNITLEVHSIKHRLVAAEVNLNVTPELKLEGIMRDIVRQVQSLRKKTGLDVDDRIVLSFSTDDSEIKQAIDEHESTIAAETLATEVKKLWGDQDLEGEGIASAKINDGTLHIKVEKHALL